jgi:hypothetical protein
MPVPASKEVLLQATLEDLKAALNSTVKNNILPPEGTDSRTILLQLNDIFKNHDKCNAKPPSMNQQPPL